MFGSMKIGTKIGAGFALMIALFCLFCGIVIFNEHSVKKECDSLSSERMPLQDNVSDMVHTISGVMLDMRTYGLTYDSSCYESAVSGFNQLDGELERIREIVSQAGLKSSMESDLDGISRAASQYRALSAETKAVAEALMGNQSAVNKTTTTFQERCDDYLSPQYEKLGADIKKGSSAEILENRRTKIRLMNEALLTGNQVQSAVYKTVISRDTGSIGKAVKHVETVEQAIDQLFPLTTKPEDIDRPEWHQGICGSISIGRRED